MLETEPGAEKQVRTAPYFCRRSESVLCKRKERRVQRGGEGGSEVVSAGRPPCDVAREVAQGHTHRDLMKRCRSSQTQTRQWSSMVPSSRAAVSKRCS